MPAVEDRLKDIRAEIQSRLDLTEEQWNTLASFAAARIVHQTGTWQSGEAVPSDAVPGRIVACFDHDPDGEGEQSDRWTFGETRVYALADGDLFGAVKQYVLAPGEKMYCRVARLFVSGQVIWKTMTEEAFTSELCDEFEELAEIAEAAGVLSRGEGGGDEDWKCPSCGKTNPDTLETDDEEAQKSSFCGGCGNARVEVVQ